VGVRCRTVEPVNHPTLIVLAAGRARRFGGTKQLAPVGVNGEAVIDLIASDAFDGGFDHVVIVINPDTGPQIRDHIAAVWPSDRRVSFATQERPLGTVNAVLSAIDVVDPDASFAVSNADDLYGRDAMIALGRHLHDSGSNCLVGFRLDRALVGDQPVTRGVCKVHNGNLMSIVERHHVHLVDGEYIADDGLQPRLLHPETRVSMNLWGFEPTMWEIFQKAMVDSEASEESEVLLPTAVGASLVNAGTTFRVLEVGSRCIGVTHAEDLAIVQASVRDQVARGERPANSFHTNK
jgi:hypothetical protein